MDVNLTCGNLTCGINVRYRHIHEGAGVTFDGNILYVNASNLNIKYQTVNYPVVIDVSHDVNQPARIAAPICTLKAKDLWGWCHDNGFLAISKLLKDADSVSLPSGNALLGQDAFDDIASGLDLFRDTGALKELRNVQAKLYAESFP
jgi:hypothetical protein